MKALHGILFAALGLGTPATTLGVVLGSRDAMAAQAVFHQSSAVHALLFPPVGPGRFEPAGPAPVPMPEQPTARLVVTGLGGKLLVDVVPFDEYGQPRPEAFAAIAEAFRAHQGDEKPIDPKLVELLLMMSQAFDGKPIALVSAHRVAGQGTRKSSYHTKGMAADIAIRGVKVHDLRKAAVRLGAPGVGVYPGFIHIDVRRDRPAYRWVGGSYSRWRTAR